MSFEKAILSSGTFIAFAVVVVYPACLIQVCEYSLKRNDTSEIDDIKIIHPEWQMFTLANRFTAISTAKACSNIELYVQNTYRYYRSASVKLTPHNVSA